jgi:hypothetical protein
MGAGGEGAGLLGGAGLIAPGLSLAETAGGLGRAASSRGGAGPDDAACPAGGTGWPSFGVAATERNNHAEHTPATAAHTATPNGAHHARHRGLHAALAESEV